MYCTLKLSIPLYQGGTIIILGLRMCNKISWVITFAKSLVAQTKTHHSAKACLNFGIQLRKNLLRADPLKKIAPVQRFLLVFRRIILYWWSNTLTLFGNITRAEEWRYYCHFHAALKLCKPEAFWQNNLAPKRYILVGLFHVLALCKFVC